MHHSYYLHSFCYIFKVSETFSPAGTSRVFTSTPVDGRAKGLKALIFGNGDKAESRQQDRKHKEAGELREQISGRRFSTGSTEQILDQDRIKMRFRFCGDLDCPDWLLAEISTLSKVTSVKMKLLCIQVVKVLLGDNMDYEKVHKLTADAKFEIGDVKASIAALRFILTSAAKYNVQGDSLSNELQQLGLPKEHSQALMKAYTDNQHKLQHKFTQQSLRLSHIDSVQWRADYIISSSELDNVNEANVHVKLNMKKPESETIQPVSFALTQDKLRLLLSELKQAKSMMDGI